MCADDRPETHKISRRGALAGVVATALPVAASRAAAVLKPALPEDEKFMREAIALAAQADFPFGAVIARDGAILARGFNSGKRLHDPTAHGEMVAIHNFLVDHGPDALKGTTLYTSGEPCPMCMGAILWCKIARVVYAASIEQLGTKLGQIMITSREIAEKTPFATIEITGGVLAAEALALFK